jgi:hypothetical protein
MSSFCGCKPGRGGSSGLSITPDLKPNKSIIKRNITVLSILAALIAPRFVAVAGSAPVKPYPSGIVDLPGAISANNPIGPIADHPWQNENVDGIRIRTGWTDIETADGVYNWVQIDECIANAVAGGKFIGLGVISGLKAPPWLMGGVSFTDGSTTINVAKLTSQTPNAFLPSDVGKVIVCEKFPPGTTIVSRTSDTVVVTSAAATATKTGNLPFSILARNAGGAKFRLLTAPDEGVMPVPWDPLAKAKWKACVLALGAKYDSHPKLRYVSMSGFCQAGESYLASAQVDVDFFNASAVAAGYVATVDLPAGLVAWEVTVKEIVDTYMTAFPTTPLFITGARPFPDSQGTKAMNEIFAWAIAKYPGRFGIMNAQLHAISGSGYYLNAAIYDNRLTQPTGIQFLCSSVADNLARLSNSTPYGTDPLLSAYNAMNASLTAAVNIGCKFVEVYETDVENAAYQTMLATQGAALLSTLTPKARELNFSTRLRVQTGNNVLIGGFIITGTTSKNVILRAIGPSLSAHGISGALQDPVLELHDHTGATIASNNNWKDSQITEIQATGIPPTDDRESAIVRTLAPGAYTAIVRGNNNTTGVGLIEGYDLVPTSNSKFGNISTRGLVQTGENVMIGGFIVGSGLGINETGSVKVLVRGIGPSLTQSGVAGALQDPVLEIHDADGAIIAQNDNWRETQQALIQATNIPPTDDRESAILRTLVQGNYTAVLYGKNSATGVALVEVYNVP